MGFFKDLKADISQAVNELLPDEEFWGLDDTEQQTSEYEMAMGDSDISVLASLLQNEMDSGNQEADDNQEEFVNLDSTNDDDIEIIAALHEMIATEEPELGTESISMPEEGEEDNIELMATVETEEPIVTEQLQKTEDIVEVEQSFEAEMKELTEIAPMLEEETGERIEAEQLLEEEVEERIEAEQLLEEKVEERTEAEQLLEEKVEERTEAEQLLEEKVEERAEAEQLLEEEIEERIEVEQLLEEKVEERTEAEQLLEEETEERAEAEQLLETEENVEEEQSSEIETEQNSFEKDDLFELEKMLAETVKEEQTFEEEVKATVETEQGVEELFERKENLVVEEQFTETKHVLEAEYVSEEENALEEVTFETETLFESETPGVEVAMDTEQIAENDVIENEAIKTEETYQAEGQVKVDEQSSGEEFFNENETSMNVFEKLDTIENNNKEKDGFTMEMSMAEAKDEVTVITKGTVINGSIISDGSLEVNGTITGDVECLGKLSINGNVSGNLKAEEVVVSTPRLDGGIESRGDVKIGVGTIVVGDVTAKSATISGAVKGEIDVQGPVVVDSTAIVKGNISAKSVQINNGAVVDGYCKLAYAEVDIDNFFDGE